MTQTKFQGHLIIKPPIWKLLIKLRFSDVGKCEACDGKGTEFYEINGICPECDGFGGVVF